MRGDQTNFVHADELLASWRIFTPALHELKDQAVQPQPYAFGSSGPADAEKGFAAAHGFSEGFRHGVDTERRRQAIAWGTSAGATPPPSRPGSRPPSRGGSVDDVGKGGV
jgi:hypothetical protein